MQLRSAGRPTESEAGVGATDPCFVDARSMKNSDRGGLKNPRTTAESHEPDTETSSANGGLPRRQLSTVVVT